MSESFGKPPFSFNDAGTFIFDSEGSIVLEIRGWGRLTEKAMGH